MITYPYKKVQFLKNFYEYRMQGIKSKLKAEFKAQ